MKPIKIKLSQRNNDLLVNNDRQIIILPRPVSNDIKRILNKLYNYVYRAVFIILFIIVF